MHGTPYAVWHGLRSSPLRFLCGFAVSVCSVTSVAKKIWTRGAGADGDGPYPEAEIPADAIEPTIERAWVEG